MSIQPHQIQYAINLISTGLLDPQTGLISGPLLDLARASITAKAEQAPRRPSPTSPKPLADAFVVTLRELATQPRPKSRIDGRTRNALIARGLAEVFECTDLEQVRAAFGAPTLLWGHGSKSCILVRITDAGRAALATVAPPAL